MTVWPLMPILEKSRTSTGGGGALVTGTRMLSSLADTPWPAPDLDAEVVALPGGGEGDEGVDDVGGPDAADGDDDVAGLEALVLGGRAGLDLLDEDFGHDGGGGLAQAFFFEGEADLGAVEGFGIEEGGEEVAQLGDGDGEADALGVGADGGVDADDLAVGVEEGTAGIAGVDGAVGLDEAGVGLGGGDVEGAIDGGDDAAGHGAGIAEGVADGVGGFADLEVFGSTEGDGFERFAGEGDDFENGQVVFVVGGDDLGFELVAVAEDALDVGALFHDVFIGDDVAGGVNDKAGAEGLELGGADEFLAVFGGEEFQGHHVNGGISGSDALGDGVGGGDVDDGVLDVLVDADVVGEAEVLIGGGDDGAGGRRGRRGWVCRGWLGLGRG